MFTGLVEAKVPLVESLVEGAGKRMGFDLGPVCDGVRIGDSIALNGCCLTVVAIDGTSCWFELGAETLSRTSLGKLEISQTANCERSLKVGDPNAMQAGGQINCRQHCRGRMDTIVIDDEFVV